MAFLPNGTWVPDQPLNAAANTMQSATQPAIRQAMTPQFSVNPQMMRPMGQPQYNQQAPMQMVNPALNAGMAHPYAQQNMINQHNYAALNPAMLSQVSNPVQQMGQGGVLPDPPPNPGKQDMIGSFQYQQPQYQQQARPQSVMQSVNNNNPQSVQNFLGALHQSNMGGSNGWQNGQGMHGQAAQAGFQGFQQNGQYSAPQTQWQGYQQPQQAQLGGYSNQARQGSPVTTGQAPHPAVAPGTGGVANQPQYQQPPPPKNLQQDNVGVGIGSAASDINSKQNIQSGSPELEDFLSHLGVYSYDYKNPKYGEGRRISPMAQEIEKSELGKVAISTNSEGYKIVDYGKLMGTQLAALALLNHKYNELETQLKTAIMQGLKEKGKK